MTKPRLVNPDLKLSPIDDIIADARAGRPVILVDDDNRENEGDIIVPASCITPELVAFMARQASGLICLALEPAMVDRLQLLPMTARNNSKFGTAFTVSIGARDGITTGISAADRAHTVKVAIDPANGPADIATPGHIFPLRAHADGVRGRAGHTEAAVEIVRLAGYEGAAVICEVMNDDGTMARLADLLEFGSRHNVKVGTIADLIKKLESK